MADLDTIMSGETPEPVQAQDVPQEEPQEATPETPDPVEEPKAEEPETTAEAPAEDPKDIPYSVFKSTREDLKGQLEETRAELARIRQERQKAPEPETVPDMFEEPEKFQQYMSRQLSNVRQSTIADVSEAMAVESYGAEEVEAAFEAVKASGEAQRFLQSRHPYGDMVKWHRQQKVFQEIGDDPDAYRAKIVEETRKQVQAEIAAQQAKDMAAKAAPSMANVNGSGGTRDPGWQGPTPLDKLIGP